LNEDKFVIPIKNHKITLIWLPGWGESSDMHLELFRHDPMEAAPPEVKVVLLNPPSRAISLYEGTVLENW
jgi:hypothetical protein